MKSFLFCTSYIDNHSEQHTRSRYRKWIDYYDALADRLGVDYLFLIDDGSAELALGDDLAVTSHHLPDRLSARINAVHFPDNLGRSAFTDYPGWWRSFTFSGEIAHKYDFEKIVHVESDFFVLSEPLFDFIRNRRHGWAGLFSSFYNFPETAIQVICKDSFGALQKIREQALQADYRFADIAECVLPFTEVVKDFRGDRLGDVSVLRQWVRNQAHQAPGPVDYVGQLPAAYPVPSSSGVLTMIGEYAARFGLEGA